jgi:hypothetical protein
LEYDPKNVKLLPAYCKLSGWAPALAYAKSGDPTAIAGYLVKAAKHTRIRVAKKDMEIELVAPVEREVLSKSITERRAFISLMTLRRERV